MFPMPRKNPLVLILMILATTGCSKDQRLADMAERNLTRQDEQNRRMSELQNEVATGTKELVEADARAREAMIGVHRDLQAERAEIGRQRDVLEEDRRDLARQRYLDPILAETIGTLGLLFAAILPLVLCWYLLHRPPPPVDDQELAQTLLEDFFTEQPTLLTRHPELPPRIGSPEEDVPRLAQEVNSDDEPT